MPLSYASYAGNGSTTSFSVPFPYILKAHVNVYLGFNILNGTYTSELVDGTGFTWTSGTQIQCTTAPAVGQTLTVIRQTPSSSRLVDWNDGSNLIAADLDTADLQNLYVVQEQQDRNDSGITQSTAATAAATAATTAANTATSTANTALSTANTALTNANAAVSTANTASTNASAAVSTANTASTNASTAVTTANAASSTANTASTNASNAVTTANAAAANASTALSTANTALTNANAAVSTANTASSNASAAVTTANTASTNASNAVTTANTASTNASAAVSTANTASTNATTAVNTANTANNKADQAIAAVSNSINYQLKANVAAIPASPANDTYIEVQDSTGLESFTPLAGMPAGFVGDSGLSVRLRFTSAGSTWNWLNYYANNSDSRYLKLIGGTLTGQIKADDSTSAATPGYAFDGDPNTGVGRPGADELALITGGTARLTIDSAGNVAVAGALTKGGSNVVTVGDSGTVTSTMLADGTIVNADINAAAAIDKTKISGTAITAADTGTVTSTMIADGAILNADVNAAAAIAGTKISPDFGSQNVTTTGTSTAASFIPSSSTAPTNGVYLPAANTVGISTGGSGRLFINSAGNVGIGAANTGAAFLEVGGSLRWQTQGIFRNSTNTSTLLRFAEIGSRDVRLDTWDGTDFNGTIRHGAQTYLVETGTGASLTERLRITSAGLVGVGTSTPDGRITVQRASNNQGISGGIAFKGQDGTTHGGVGTDGVNTNNLQILAAQGIYFHTGNTDGTTNIRATLDSSGRLGIGSSVPGATLDVRSGTDNSTIFKIDGGGGGNRGLVVSTEAVTVSGSGFNDARIVYNAQSNTGGSARGEHDFRVNGTSALKIDYQNRVGIGTATVDSDVILKVKHSASSSFAFRVENNSGTNTLTLGASDPEVTASGAPLYLTTTSSQPIIARTSSTERARIDSSGRLLVGTSSWSDSEKLVLRGNANNDDEAFLSLVRGSAPASDQNLGVIIFYGNGSATESARISALRDGGTWNAGSSRPSRLAFSTCPDGSASPVERLRIASTGALGLAGANYGSSGQVLTSNGSGSAPSWQAASAPAALSTASGSAPSYSVRAWAVWNGSNGSVSNSGNCSSVSRSANGRYQFNFNTALPSSNYVGIGGGSYRDGSDDGNAGYITFRRVSSAAITTTYASLMSRAGGDWPDLPLSTFMVLC